MNYDVATCIDTRNVVAFIRTLYHKSEWVNTSEMLKNYDYSAFSQKKTIEKYVIGIEGAKVYFTVQHADDNDTAKDKFNLEISYSDDPEMIYEIPRLDDSEVKGSMSTLYEFITHSLLDKYRKMNARLLDLSD